MPVAQKQLELVFDFGTPEKLDPVQRVICRGDASIGDRFRAFHAANPHVYLAVTSMARHLRREYGLRRVGMKAIFEQLRWRHKLATRGEEWRLNNNFTSEYARLVMQQEHDLRDFFETRELKRRK